MPLASEVNGRALVLSGLDVSGDAVELELRRRGADERVRLERLGDLHRLDLLRKLLEELFVDRLLNKDARTGAAALSVGEYRVSLSSQMTCESRL